MRRSIPGIIKLDQQFGIKNPWFVKRSLAEKHKLKVYKNKQTNNKNRKQGPRTVSPSNFEQVFTKSSVKSPSKIFQ